MEEIKQTRKFFDELPPHIKVLQKAIPPYMPFVQGYGFQGVMLLDEIEDKVQCHYCGKWYKALSAHIKTHGLGASDYKKEVGLYQSEALMSLRTKYLFKRKNSKKSRNNLTRRGNIVQIKKEKEVSNGSQTTQWKNKYGTCDAQLKYRLEVAIEKYGRVPMIDEEPNLASVLKRRHGNYEQALKEYGYELYKGSNRLDLTDAPQCLICNKAIDRKKYSSGDWEDLQRWRERKTCSPEHLIEYLAIKFPERKCSVDGCDEKYSAKGYCNIHYLKMVKNGRRHAKRLINV